YMLDNSVTMSGSTTFGGSSPNTGNLTFNGGVTIGGAAKTCTVNGITLTFSGAASGGGDSTHALTVAGTGTLVFSGNSTAYNKTTTINSGSTLIINGSGQWNSGS